MWRPRRRPQRRRLTPGRARRRSVNLALVTPGATPRERELNAKYLISSARKMGCLIFLLWCARGAAVPDPDPNPTKSVYTLQSASHVCTAHRSACPSD